MKKVLSVLFVSALFAFVACGPSEEEKAKMEAEAKAKMDSLFNAASQGVTEATDSTNAAPQEEAAPVK
jgi:hypothetical protein